MLSNEGEHLTKFHANESWRESKTRALSYMYKDTHKHPHKSKGSCRCNLMPRASTPSLPPFPSTPLTRSFDLYLPLKFEYATHTEPDLFRNAHACAESRNARPERTTGLVTCDPGKGPDAPVATVDTLPNIPKSGDHSSIDCGFLNFAYLDGYVYLSFFINSFYGLRGSASFNIFIF